MPRAQRQGSPRRLVEQFAAHLAYLLNSGTGACVKVSPYELYRSLTRTLSSSGYSRLIGLGLAEPGTSAEQAAESYFDAVLDRRLFLRGNEQRHKGHALFLAMCRRGAAQGWDAAALERRHAPRSAVSPEAGTTHMGHSADPRHFADVAEKLAKLDHTVTTGNPAATTLAKLGALWLEVGNACTVTPEELSVWKGVVSGPTELERLAKGKEFDAFCSTVIKAAEAANAPFAALVSLGLSPRDWAGEISTNTAKKLGAFLSEVRKAASEDGDDCKPVSGSLETWRRIWMRRQVPGYASVDELWNSPLGRALRFPAIARSVDVDSIEEEFERTAIQDGNLLTEDQDFQVLVVSAAQDAAVDEFDIWLLESIRCGDEIADLEPTARVRLRLGTNGDLATYLDELTKRLLNWSQGKLVPFHPDKDPDGQEDL